jgi:outer membrane protein assembly factor BamB
MSTLSPSPKVRWWPAAAVAVLVAAYLAAVWLGEAPSNQDRVIRTFPGLFFGVLLLLAWLFFFSRLPGRLRLGLFAGLAGAAVLFFSLFHIEGVSGNLVPIVRPKWSAARDFGGRAETRAGVTAPGPYDWPQFNGPRRDGRTLGVRLARDWEARAPRELWRHAVGEGWSSFAVVGNAAVTQEQRRGKELVVRYELATGRAVWTHAYEAAFDTTVGGSGPRATPAIAGGRVYSLGALGHLTALDLDDGSLLWSVNVVEAHGAEVPEWGVAGSPLVVGDLVIVQPGWSSEVSLAAYRRDDGTLAWTAGGHRGSFSSPYYAEVAGRPQVVIVNQESVDAYDPETGEELWTTAWPGAEPKVSMPLALGDDTLLVSAGYGIGSRLLRITAEGGGPFAVEDVWESPRLKSKFANMVLHRDPASGRDTVFGLDDGVLVAIDPASGERRWKSGRYGHGQLVLAGDLLLVQTEKGPVVLVAADPEAHRELGRLPAVDGKTWNPPVVSGRHLLVRNNREAVCYELPVEG